MKYAAISRVVGSAALVLGAMIVGSATHLPALAAADYQQFVGPTAVATCASTDPCLKETNSKKGAGIEGISSKGSGSIGLTKFNSTTIANGVAGVLGQDSSTSGTFDSGVLGTSTNGNGVQGQSSFGAGVRANSTYTSALFSESTYGDGAQLIGDNNDGTNSTTANNSTNSGVGRSGVWGHDDTTDGGSLNYGVAGSSVNGTGMLADSTNWIGENVIGGATTYNGYFIFYPALSISSNTYLGVPMDILDGCSGTSPCSNGNYVVRINGNGDEYLQGQLFTAGSCSAGCAKTRGTGRRVISYAPHEAQPTMEDVGEAQLVGGRADVALEAKFASVIDRGARYFVFVTPEGDCDQLFVTGRNASGFSVRESHGGRSNVAFQYRIVARPFGNTSARLPDIQMRAGHSRTPTLQ